MRRLLFFAALFFVSVLFLFTNSCSKKDSGVTPTIANISGTYTFTETAQKASGPVYDPRDSACQKDDEIKFNTDSTYNYIDAGTVCSPSNSFTDLWTLPNSSTILLGAQVFAIESFNNKILVLAYTNDNVTPAITYTITLTKQ
ncbi:MAG TPA: hypothetical protein VKT28_17310 [Puia sp.]|nr:hypothetical protein [Puia sp.]